MTKAKHMTKANQKSVGIVIVVVVIIIAGIVYGIYKHHADSAPRNNSTSSSQSSSSGSNSQQNQDSQYSNPADFTVSQFADVIGGYRISEGIAALQEDPSLDAAANLYAYGLQTGNNSETYVQRVENAIPAATTYAYYDDGLCSDANTSQETSTMFTNTQGNDDLLSTNFQYYGVGIAPNTATTGTCNGYLVVLFAGTD